MGLARSLSHSLEWKLSRSPSRSLSHSLEWKLSRSPGSLVISFLGMETLSLSWLARYLIPWNGNSLALLLARYLIPWNGNSLALVARSLSHSLEWKLSRSRGSLVISFLGME